MYWTLGIIYIVLLDRVHRGRSAEQCPERGRQGSLDRGLAARSRPCLAPLRNLAAAPDRALAAVTLTVVNPATEEPIAELEQAGVEETDEAVARAKEAYPAWRAVAPADRASCCGGWRRSSRSTQKSSRRSSPGTSASRSPGARGEIGMVAQVFHFYAGAVDKHYGQTIPVAAGVAATFREPLGVVGLIVPWNFPLNISSWKLGPALACGNTVVLKPAELTPLSALRLAELVLEAGIPEGVVNVLVGKGSVVGQRLIEHPDVAKIGFTGSTEVGRLVMQGAAGTIKRVTLELGGKSANVIFEDADLERAAASAPYAVFDNAGQDCCARSRILVQRIGLRPLSRRPRRGDEGRQGRRPGGRVDRDGSAHQRPSTGRRSPPSSTESLVFRGEAPSRAGFWFPLHDRRGDERRSDRARGGLRARGGRHPVRGRSGRGADRERHAVRPVRLDLDAGRRPRASRRARDWTRACSR